MIGVAIVLCRDYTDYVERDNSAQNSEDRRDSAEERLAIYTFWLDWATVTLAVSTLGLWIATWRSGVKQGRDTRRSLAIGSKTADAAQRSAEAAQGSVNISRQALITVERAFVFIRTFEVHVLNDNVIIMPKWENSGSTPANDKVNWVNWKAFAGEPPPGFYNFDLDISGQPINGRSMALIGFIAPHATQYAEMSTIPIACIEEVKAGTLRLFVWGWIEYPDVFDEISAHRTEFCSEVIATGISRNETTRETTVALQFAHYGPYNTSK